MKAINAKTQMSRLNEFLGAYYWPTYGYGVGDTERKWSH